MKKLIYVMLAVMLLAVASSYVIWRYVNREQVQVTENKHMESIRNWFSGSVISLDIDSSGAHFKIDPTKSKFVIGDPATIENYSFSTDFTLTHSGQIFFRPDHHGSIIYTVIRIHPDRIDLHYISHFDLHSFGKNISGSDQGDFSVYSTKNKTEPSR